MAEESNHASHCCGCPICREQPDGDLARQHRDINRLAAALDEKGRRLLAGFLAQQHGRGGITALAAITGLSRNTIRRGLRELRRPDAEFTGRIRRPGGGRPRVEKKARRSSRP